MRIVSSCRLPKVALTLCGKKADRDRGQPRKSRAVSGMRRCLLGGLGSRRAARQLDVQRGPRLGTSLALPETSSSPSQNKIVGSVLISVARFIALLLLAGVSSADEPWQGLLNDRILPKDQTVQDVVEFVQSRLPALTVDSTSQEWEAKAARLRSELLEQVVYRGAAAGWRDANCKVEWLQTEPGGSGYKLRKLRYEALPGLWIPAVLYEPEQLSGPTPVVLNVNGHDALGKAAEYKQLRCINQAKRGMLALNIEWLGMGQLRKPGYAHGRMNQLDLCGASGLAPFYLSMKRGLDILLSLPNADPKRVAVAGLSGGGWQTIFISALDTRVTLSNPVAGYSGFATRLQHWSDLGDSEQTPLDMATIADYTHLTAMLAPRAALLTYNVKDNCCFASGHALPPLLESARPAYALYGKTDYLHHYVNLDPGDHNFGKDNREALYRVLATHFAAPGSELTVTEIDSAGEVKTSEQLNVDLPDQNADFNTLANDLVKGFPPADPPKEADKLTEWQTATRVTLRRQVRYRSETVTARQEREVKGDGWQGRAWTLQLGTDWHIPVVEIEPDGAERTRILLSDAGRTSLTDAVASALKEKTRVLAVDPYHFGESLISQRAYLFALMINTVGERPLGIQAGQVTSVSRWAADKWKVPVEISAFGPRTSCIGLVTTALEPGSIARLNLQDAYPSLNVVVKENLSFDIAPELFCAGLLATCDLPVIRELIAPEVLR